MNTLPVIDQDHFDVLRLAGTLDEKRKHIFLRVLAETASLKLAVEAAGYRNTAAVNRLRKEDAAFNEAFLEASEAAADVIESEVVRRAIQGVKEAVWFKGEIVGYEIKYSDSLAALLLKAAKPEKYAERSKTEQTTSVKVGIAVIPMVSRDVEGWERQARMVHDQQKALPGNAVDAEFKEVTPKLERT